MTPSHRAAEDLQSGEPLRLVGEIAQGVAQAPVEELPRILGRVLEAVRVVTGLDQGVLILLDFVFNESYTLSCDGEASGEPVRSSVSGASPAPGLREPGAPARRREIAVAPVRETDLLIEVPVVAGTRDMGLLCILSRGERLSLAAAGRSYLETLASLAAIAIDRRRRGKTLLLVDTLRAISDEEDLDRLVELVVLHALELLYADAGALFLRHEETFEPRWIYPPEEQGMAALGAAGVRRWLADLAAADLRQVLFLPEPGSPPELPLVPDARSSVLVPIRTDSRLLAFLLLESRQTDPFSADPKLLEVLASQAAVSINRVQLLNYREEARQGLLVSANAITVGQIATSFIHEAKNSLNGMTLTVHNLLEDIAAEPDLKAKRDYTERLSIVLTEMQRLDDLSRRLQRFTRQGLHPDKQPVYLNDIVASTLQVLESVLRRKHMRFEERLDPSLDRPAGKSSGSAPVSGKMRGHPVAVDELQIQQVLMNLILNAVAASPERSPLVIETRRHPGHVEVRVTDHGTGISGEAKRKLFTPFFTTKREGVGLGLFISRLLIEENHGGSIEITSTAPGRGSTFTIRLPAPG